MCKEIKSIDYDLKAQSLKFIRDEIKYRKLRQPTKKQLINMYRWIALTET